MVLYYCGWQDQGEQAGFRGKEIVLAFFGPGEMIGEVAVFEKKPYPASARAILAASLVGIEKEDFLRFMKSRPGVALRIISILSGRLRESKAVFGTWPARGWSSAWPGCC